MRCLYILEIKPLSVSLFANVIYHSVRCHFILLIVSFAVQKLFTLIRSHLFIFAFISITLGGGFPQNIAVIYVRLQSVLPTFSFRSFIVSGLTFRSLIHFEFIFVHAVRECSNFILLHMDVQFSEHHILKKLSFPHCIFLPLLT